MSVVPYESINEKQPSIWKPLYNVVCTVAGTGILQLAFTLRQSGWIQLIILFVCAFMANFTGKLIIECLYEDSAPYGASIQQGNRLDGYMAVGEKAFGTAGRYLVHFFQKMELGGVCCLFLILCGKFFTEGLSTSPQDFIPLDTQKWILVSASLVSIPVLAFHDMHETALLSLFGVFATILVVLTIVSYSSYYLISGTHTYGGQITADWGNLPITFAGTVVSFGGQPVYPSIQQDVERSQWPKVLNYAYCFLMVLYIPTAVLGYGAFGDTTYSPILCNLPQSGIITIFMKLLIAFHVLCAYPILMNVLCREAETAFLKSASELHPFSSIWFMSRSIRLSIVGLTVFIAYFVPYFADFMSFLGGVAVAFNTYVLPIIFYLKLKETSMQQKILCISILVVAAIAGSVGGIMSLKELIKKFRDDADPLDG